MSSSLSVQINGGQAQLMRGGTQIGAFRLDEHLQIQEVMITAAASSADVEQILKLAASHVAQYIVTPRTFREVRSTVLIGTPRTFPPIPGLTPDDSRRLLDFNNIAPQHAEFSIRDIRSLLTGLRIRVGQQR